MSRLDDLIQEYCPDGVEYKPLWSLTIWDKKFNAVDRKKQPKTYDYYYYLANDLKPLVIDGGDVKILTTNNSSLYTKSEMCLEHIVDREIVAIPWGGNPTIQYYKGKFITADNRIAAVRDQSEIDTKYLFYVMQNQLDLISSFYRGSGIKHPDMGKVLDLQIPVPPLPVQEEIVRILDTFTELTAELSAELSAELAARKKQYEYYQYELLTFDENTPLIPLKNIANVFRGEYITQKNTTPGEIPVILGGQEPAYYINRSNHVGEIVAIARSGVSAGFVSYWNEPIFITDGFGYEAKIDTIKPKYLYYALKRLESNLNAMKRGAGVPHVSGETLGNVLLPVPPIDVQERCIKILDNFNDICTDISTGLPAEIEARQKQYEYYRDKLLTFKELKS